MRGALVLLAALAPALWGQEFFPMDTVLMKTFLIEPIQREDVEKVAQAGFRGTAVTLTTTKAWDHLTGNVMPWLDEKKLKLYAAYSFVQVRKDGYTIDPDLKRNLPALKTHGSVIWLPISSKEFKPSDPSGDAMAAAAVREVADMAAEYGLKVSLYPHIMNLVERTGDAVRIAALAGRANVGVTFNLCHTLRTDGADAIEAVLKAAMPRLTMVTINGADRDGKEWIQPLDSGNLDVAGLLRMLAGLGYHGPIGLQGWSVAARLKIDPSENLRRSMEAWKRIAGAK